METRIVEVGMTAEWGSLLVGILFSAGVFAVKAGLGLQYVLSREDRMWMRSAVCAASFVFYGLLIGACVLWLRRANMPAYFQTAQAFLQVGMLLHFIAALLMLSWGVALIRARDAGRTKRLGWLMLVFPCPVCATVMVLSLAFLMAYFPGAVLESALSLYGGFIVIGVLSMLLMKEWSRISAPSPEHALGVAMVVLAAYFLLSVLIMPHFAGLEEVFRLAVHSHAGHEVNSLTGWAIAGVQGTLFVAGYLRMSGKMRRSICWKSALS